MFPIKSMGTTGVCHSERCIIPPEVDQFLKNKLNTFEFAFTITDPYKPDNPISFASAKFCEMTGYDSIEIIGKNCRFLQGPLTERRKVMEIRDAIREQRPCQVLLLNYRKNRQPFWNQFYMAPLWGADGKLQHYVGIQTDVTTLVEENKHPDYRVVLVDGVPEVVQQEHQAATNISMAIQGSPSSCCTELPCSLMQPLLKVQQSFVLADPSLPDMPIVHASDAFLELSGYPREEVIGRNCRFLQGPGTDPGEVSRLRAAISADPPQPVTVTLLNYRQDGTPFWNSLHVAPIRDADGRVAFFVGVQLDVSQVKDVCQDGADGVLALGTPAPLALSQKLAQKGVVGSVRVAVRSLGGDSGLRRSMDCGPRPSTELPHLSSALCQQQPWCMPSESQQQHQQHEEAVRS
uniref:Putative LOV domain-containing protein n=1 Tax=Chaetopeltis orbicularis TaxID=56002 RepID=A0A126WWI8_9CHLO|nr:putative LOV domain-containing protein [Chaetopeltis orbicularis]